MRQAALRPAARRQLRDHYDSLGTGQDREAWYEDPAFDDLTAMCRFEAAERVVELGCGTGRLAERLLTDHLAGSARYLGFDASPVMAGLTAGRLARFGARCRVAVCDIIEGLPLADGAADRLVMTFVLDLLEPAEAQAVLDEARRVLAPDGLICLSGLDRGGGPRQRLRGLGWRIVRALAPLKVGGCRPIDLEKKLESGWIVQENVRRNIKNCAIASVCARPGQAASGL